MSRLIEKFNKSLKSLWRFICLVLRPYEYDPINPYRRWDRNTGQQEEVFTYYGDSSKWEPVGTPKSEKRLK